MKIVLTKREVEDAIKSKHGQGDVTLTDEGGAEIEVPGPRQIGYAVEPEDEWPEPPEHE